MAIYVVMEPPGRSEKADVTFVRDGFAWLGFLVAPLWLAWHRLWVEAALAFVVMAILSMLGEKLGLGLGRLAAVAAGLALHRSGGAGVADRRTAPPRLA